MPRALPTSPSAAPTRRYHLFQPLFLFKGFQAVLAYRIAHALWEDGDEGGALLLQSERPSSSRRHHPAAAIGAGVMLDHGTGVVIGRRP